jgi:hypothetical protein
VTSSRPARAARLTEGDIVTRIPGHTIADAPEASRPLLEGVVQFSPTGKPLNLHAQVDDQKADSLVRVVREAAARAGEVSDPAWQRAIASGWTSQELAEAFAYLSLTIFTAYFLTYAQTPLDLPVGVPATGQRG